MPHSSCILVNSARPSSNAATAGRLEPRGERLGCEKLDLGGCQFDGERQPVDPANQGGRS